MSLLSYYNVIIIIIIANREISFSLTKTILLLQACMIKWRVNQTKLIDDQQINLDQHHYKVLATNKRNRNLKQHV